MHFVYYLSWVSYKWALVCLPFEGKELGYFLKSPRSYKYDSFSLFVVDF